MGRWSVGRRSVEAHRLELGLWLGLWSSVTRVWSVSVRSAWSVTVRSACERSSERVLCEECNSFEVKIEAENIFCP